MSALSAIEKKSMKFACIVVFMLIVCCILNLKLKRQWKGFQPRRNKIGTNKAEEFGIMTLKRAIDIAKLKEKIVLYWCPPDVAAVKSRHRKFCGWCTASSNRSLITDRRTAAVIFHNNCMSRKEMPPDHLRKPDMYYIWFNMESPLSQSLSKKPLTDFETNYFNATMTYRRDSAFHQPYMPSNLVLGRVSAFIPKKKRLGIWIVSNCHSHFGAVNRMKYFKELLKSGLKVDAYGKCFNKLVKLQRGKKEFFQFLGDYKFYFAFENSFHCRDYITEKFMQHGLYSGTIPIVWGPKKSDVEAIAPPRSFIHVEDFKSAKDLANYISYLDKNNTAYMEYHEWRNHLPRTDPYSKSSTGLCLLCRTLHGIEEKGKTQMSEYYLRYLNHSFRKVKVRRSLKHRVVQSLNGWWYGTDNRECLFND
nr:alpha-(1,3)-fucosyltransferase 9-like isoform X2 [Ciona intestinalis]XP_026692119.1 alpha-(1,3)-fucosyltransferase 9-like isoform X2 [Ciona intestinalis]|eukprot:XP_026692118.1 alpha-(1,3)-fucosyltransferase 9-like isoform X2 [Ciona intestinalis]